MKYTSAAAVLVATLAVVLLSCSEPSGPLGVTDPTPSILEVTLQGGGEGTAVRRGMSIAALIPVSRGGESYQAVAGWTQCPDDDFHRYILYRSGAPNISSDPESADTCAIFSSVSVTSWTDTTISEGDTWYYVLRTVNDNDLDSWSNEEVIHVPPAAPPTPSDLQGSYTGSGTEGQISLIWTQCPDDDFHSYRIYRSLNPGIQSDPESADLMCENTGVSEVTWKDNEVQGLTTYHYAVETVDETELSSWSNEVSVTTPDLTPRLTVFFIDPSHSSYYSGDAMLLKTPGERFYLIDGGDRAGSWSCGVEKVLPLLDSLGADSLDGIVATHPHSDHIGGLIGVLENIPVAVVWDSGYEHSSLTYEDYLEAVYINGSDFIIPRRGDILDWDDELLVECLHPVDPLGSDINNSSIVLRITFENVTFLFTGDLQSEGELDIIGTVGDVTADVLKVGHHGSYTSTSTEWLSAVNPSYAAIEVGYGNPYGHPHDEVIQRLDTWGAAVYRTDQDGTFIISTDGSSIEVYP